jgi:hypothetical protein
VTKAWRLFNTALLTDTFQRNADSGSREGYISIFSSLLSVALILACLVAGTLLLSPLQFLLLQASHREA